MNKKIFLLALITLLVIGCKNKPSDPLNGFVIGSNESSWKNHIEKLLKQKKITKNNDENNYLGFILDSTYVKFQLNSEFYFGKLLDYKISFQPNSYLKNYDNRYYFLPYYIDYKVISRILGEMIQIYGSPDSVILGRYYRAIYKNFREKPLIDSLISGFTVLWEGKESNLCFNVGDMGFIMDSITKQYISYKLSDCYIEYKHPNYVEEIRSICDSIIDGYRIVDYIKSEVDNPEIKKIGYDYSIPNRKISFSVITVDRIENLDFRGIISILTDFVFYDNFENELARFEDIELEFGDYKLVTSKRAYNRLPNESLELALERANYEHNRILIYSKYFYYSSRASELQKLESAYQKGMLIKAKLEVKAIKLDDSSVLKRPVS